VVHGGLDAGASLAGGVIGAAGDLVSAGGHLIGGPIGDAISGAAHGVSGVAGTVVEGVGHALGEGVGGLLQTAGDMTQTVGNGAAHIATDLGSLANDVAHGNLNGVINDVMHLAQDGFKGDGIQIASLTSGEAQGASQTAAHGGFWDNVAHTVSNTIHGVDGALGHGSEGVVASSLRQPLHLGLPTEGHASQGETGGYPHAILDPGPGVEHGGHGEYGGFAGLGPMHHPIDFPGGGHGPVMTDHGPMPMPPTPVVDHAPIHFEPLAAHVDVHHFGLHG
jgi:hypothetical protein